MSKSQGAYLRVTLSARSVPRFHRPPPPVHNTTTLLEGCVPRIWQTAAFLLHHYCHVYERVARNLLMYRRPRVTSVEKKDVVGHVSFLALKTPELLT